MVPIRTVDVDVGDESEHTAHSAHTHLEASDAALDAMSSEDRPKAALEAVGDVRRRGVLYLNLVT